MTSEEIVAHPLLGPYPPEIPFGPNMPTYIGQIMFATQGQVLTGNSDGRGGGAVILWNTNITSWIAHACSIANRNLTPAEWKQFVGDEPFGNVCPGHLS
jgi:hypothetical protein